MKTNLWRILAAVLAVLLLAALYRSCQYDNALQRLSTASARKDTIITRITDSEGREHAKAEARLITISDLKRDKSAEAEKLKSEIKHWKDLASVTRFTTSTRGGFTAINVPGDTVIIREAGDTVRMPFTGFTFTDKWLTFHGDIFTDSTVGRYAVKNDFDIIYKRERLGWFKPKLLTVEVISGNPNSTVTGMNNFVIAPEKKKFWETRIFAFGVGMVGGYLINEKQK